jgi:hypothetical protein
MSDKFREQDGESTREDSQPPPSQIRYKPTPSKWLMVGMFICALLIFFTISRWYTQYKVFLMVAEMLAFPTFVSSASSDNKSRGVGIILLAMLLPGLQLLLTLPLDRLYSILLICVFGIIPLVPQITRGILSRDSVITTQARVVGHYCESETDNYGKAHQTYWITIQFDVPQADGRIQNMILKAHVQKSLYETAQLNTLISAHYPEGYPEILLFEGE